MNYDFDRSILEPEEIKLIEKCIKNLPIATRIVGGFKLYVVMDYERTVLHLKYIETKKYIAIFATTKQGFRLNVMEEAPQNTLVHPTPFITIDLIKKP